MLFSLHISHNQDLDQQYAHPGQLLWNSNVLIIGRRSKIWSPLAANFLSLWQWRGSTIKRRGHLKSYRKRKGQLVLHSLKMSYKYNLHPILGSTCTKILFCIFLNFKGMLDFIPWYDLHLNLSIKTKNEFYKNCMLQMTWERVLLQTFDQKIYLNGSKI